MTEISHKDIIGNPIKLGDTVVSPNRTQLEIGIVEKITAKMVLVKPVGKRWSDRRYPSNLLVVNDPKVTLYMLKYENKK